MSTFENFAIWAMQFAATKVHAVTFIASRLNDIETNFDN